MAEKATYEVIRTKSRLAKKAVKGRGPKLEEIVARGETGLAGLRAEYAETARTKAAAMADNLAALKSALAVESREEAHRFGGEIYRAALEIKGDAGAMEFPFIGQIAGSLRNYLDKVGHVERRVALEVMDVHINTLQLAIARNLRDAQSTEARTLLASLNEMTRSVASRH